LTQDEHIFIFQFSGQTRKSIMFTSAASHSSSSRDISGVEWGGRGNFPACRGTFWFQIFLLAASQWFS